ncbi:MAG: hypothetical protein J0H12_06835 [Candidatus Paracaedimonas acanthamoebae]|uniref:Uncharacterized protein n=1 Tax=Candidatus Paracaedimonas acanthamoebae TaxID=244581 RepID=A0A8J7PN06_9PROT|nr:hypothetical protein [Candidatus Paracaedimonas acanthamoebae]
MFKMKKYALLIIGSLSWFHSVQSSQNCSLYEGDLETSKTKSLISGVTLDELHSGSGKAALTLGYKEIGGGIKHAYLVFETPIEKGKKGEIKIIEIQGVHFGGDGDGYYEPDSVYGAVCGGGKGLIYEENDENVIKKFLRAKKTKIKATISSNGIKRISEEEIMLQEAAYTKYKSFIVSAAGAQKALASIGEDKIKGTYFSLKGWGLTDKDRTYNCTSYVATLLKRAGVELPIGDSTFLVKDDIYLANKISQFELKTEAERNGIAVIDPPSAEELLKTHGIN